MELFLHILFLVTFLLLFFGGALVFIPLRYKIQGGYRKKACLTVQIKQKPLFRLKAYFDGSLLLSFTLLGIPFKIQPKKKKSPEKKKERGQKEKRSNGVNIRPWADQRFLKSILIFSGDVFKMLRPEHLEIRGKIGFEDPCYNGYVAAFNWFCQTSLPPQRVKVDLETLWDKEYYNVTAAIFGKVAVYLILYRAIRLLLSKEVRKIWREIRADKNKRKIKKEAVFSG